MANQGNEMTTADAQLAQPGQENLTSQIQHKVEELGGQLQGLKQAAADGFAREHDAQTSDTRTIGQRLDAATAAANARASDARAAVEGQVQKGSETVREAVVDPVGDKLVQAGEALREKSAAMAPPPQDKTLVERVQEGVEAATQAVREGFSSLTGPKPVAEGSTHPANLGENGQWAAVSLGDRVDEAVAGVSEKVETAREAAQGRVDEARARLDETKEAVAGQLSKAGDALVDAGTHAKGASAEEH